MLEDVNGVFTKKIDLNIELSRELNNGLKKYSELAEFNFIAGYTISIFPYQFGNYEELQIKGRAMLKKAFELKPENPYFEMIYLGSQGLDKKIQAEYERACVKSQLEIKTEFIGKGLLNEYFTQILNRD